MLMYIIQLYANQSSCKFHHQVRPQRLLLRLLMYTIGYDHPLTLFVGMLVPNARTLSHPHHGLLDALNCTLYAVGCQRRNPNVALRGKGEAASPAVDVPRRFSYRDL